MDQNMDDLHHFMPGLELPEFSMNIQDQSLAMHNFQPMPPMGFQDSSSRMPNTAGMEAQNNMDPATTSSRGTQPVHHLSSRSNSRSREDLHQIKLQNLQQLQHMQSQLVNTQMEILKLTHSIQVQDKPDAFLGEGAAATYPTPTSSESTPIKESSKNLF